MPNDAALARRLMDASSVLEGIQLFDLSSEYESDPKASGTGGYLTERTALPDSDAFSTESGQLGIEYRENGASRASTLPQALLANWSRLALSGLSAQSYSRLSMLSSGARVTALTARSLTDFLGFWKFIRKNAKEPRFVVNGYGYLQTEWHKSWARHLEVEFPGDGLAYFSLIEGPALLQGKDEIVEIANALANRHSKPLTWTDAK